MVGTPLFGGLWGPILHLDLENWTVFLEILDLSCDMADFVPGLYFPDDPLKLYYIILENVIRNDPV